VSGFDGNDTVTNTALLSLIIYEWIYTLLSLALAFLENKKRRRKPDEILQVLESQQFV
jgi:hypothetical protein